MQLIAPCNKALSRQRAVKAGGAALFQASMAYFHRKDTLQPKLGTKYFFLFKYMLQNVFKYCQQMYLNTEYFQQMYLNTIYHGILNTRTSTLPCTIKIPDNALPL